MKRYIQRKLFEYPLSRLQLRRSVVCAVSDHERPVFDAAEKLALSARFDTLARCAIRRELDDDSPRSVGRTVCMLLS